MAGNIAHMIICMAAIRRFSDINKAHQQFIEELFGENLSNQKRLVWANLGSLAPDLFYYKNPIRQLWIIFAGKNIGAERLEPWSYHMHSIRPNEFPLKLIELTFRDAIIKNGRAYISDIDLKKIAFIAGYLTHIATDQVIHLSANKISGPYYREGCNRETHRNFEIHLDYKIYMACNMRSEFGHPFSKLNFSNWAFYEEQEIKAIYKSFQNYAIRHPSIIFSDLFFNSFTSFGSFMRFLAHHKTDEWFSPFLQRSFAEVYGSFPKEKEILNSIICLNLLLSFIGIARVYKKAKAEYDNEYRGNPILKEYFSDKFYNDFEASIKKSTDYLEALFHIYTNYKSNNNIHIEDRNNFLLAINDNDLSYP